MSGTSLDGIDVALIETDGETISIHRGANGSALPAGETGGRAYSEDERALLQAALAEAPVLTDRRERPGRLAEAEDLVTRSHAEAVQAFLAANELSAADIDVVGFHGQTVLHRPAEGLTV